MTRTAAEEADATSSSKSRGGFLGNVIKLFAGNASAQLLTLLAYPILTRLYAPADLGILAFIGTVIAVVGPCAALSYQTAIPLARSEEEAGNSVAVCLAAVLGIVVLFVLIALLLPQSLLDQYDSVAPFRLFVPLGILGSGCYLLAVYEATRNLRYADVAKSRVYQSLTGPSLQVALGAFGLGTAGLIVGLVVGTFSGTYGLVRRLKIFWPPSPLFKVTLSSMWATAVRYRDFPLYSSWTALIAISSNNLMNLTFTILYGPTIGGFVFLGDRVLGRPLSLITLAISQVFVGEASRTIRERPEELRRLFLAVAARQLVMSAVWVGGVVLLAPRFVPLVFGADWASAVIYLQFLAFGFFFTSLLAPIVLTLQIIESQKLQAAMESGRFVAIAGALVIAKLADFEPEYTVLTCSFVQMLAQGTCFVVIYRAVVRFSTAASPRQNLPAPAEL
jgi:O-antigen/teichoic acid export membrane protein